MLWILTIMCVCFFACAFCLGVFIFFADEISAYMKARTEMLQAMTETLREEHKQDIRESRAERFSKRKGGNNG